MKKLINDPYRVTLEAIDGYVAAFPDAVRRVHDQAVVRADAPIADKVGVVIGGGSGHEPLFMGYLGKGFADGCPVGNIFASPSPDVVLAATRAVSAGAGVLYLYGNYAGDIMNFDMAAEVAEEEGIPVRTVRVTDDVASAPRDEIERRRGIAGDFFVFKAAGARAEEGGTLEEVYAAARHANDNTRTMGVALSSCTIPASGRPIFQLGEDEVELGLGIHGEPGAVRQKLEPTDAVTARLVTRVLEDLPFQPGDQVAVLVNGLGATPLGELYIVFRRVAQLLCERNIRIHRSYVGEYSTSLEMAGCSVTLIRVDDELRRLIDRPAFCPCFVQV
jgi:phosphoenolpyruvate---glycerone phosphotransferase subunit DhaK